MFRNTLTALIGAAVLSALSVTAAVGPARAAQSNAVAVSSNAAGALDSGRSM